MKIELTEMEAMVLEDGLKVLTDYYTHRLKEDKETNPDDPGYIAMTEAHLADLKAISRKVKKALS